MQVEELDPHYFGDYQRLLICGNLPPLTAREISPAFFDPVFHFVGKFYFKSSPITFVIALLIGCLNDFIFSLDTVTFATCLVALAFSIHGIVRHLVRRYYWMEIQGYRHLLILLLS